MRDKKESILLGIPIKRTAVIKSFELAPIYEEANLAVDVFLGNERWRVMNAIILKFYFMKNHCGVNGSSTIMQEFDTDTA